jgi:hypothetical protein
MLVRFADYMLGKITYILSLMAAYDGQQAFHAQKLALGIACFRDAVGIEHYA